MRFSDFILLLEMARDMSDYSEFLEKTKSFDWYDERIVSTGVLFSLWQFVDDPSVRKLRAFADRKRVRFSEDYNIPLRTIENWEMGKSSPTPWITQLLAFAVFSNVYSVPAADKKVTDHASEVEGADNR